MLHSAVGGGRGRRGAKGKHFLKAISSKHIIEKLNHVVCDGDPDVLLLGLRVPDFLLFAASIFQFKE